MAYLRVWGCCLRTFCINGMLASRRKHYHKYCSSGSYAFCAMLHCKINSFRTLRRRVYADQFNTQPGAFPVYFFPGGIRDERQKHSESSVRDRPGWRSCHSPRRVYLHSNFRSGSRRLPFKRQGRTRLAALLKIFTEDRVQTQRSDSAPKHFRFSSGGIATRPKSRRSR